MTGAPPAVRDIAINEIRIDQPGDDGDEYFELFGEAGSSLDGLSLIVIGDGDGFSGTIEYVLDLTGSSLDEDGFFLAAESTFTLGTPDLTAVLNFENSDNLTFFLVEDFTGAQNDDIDANDDGVIDFAPFSAIVDEVALIETVGSGELVYSDVQVGPDNGFVPAHVFRNPDGTGDFQIGGFDPAGGNDTPGFTNVPVIPPALTLISDIQGNASEQITVNGRDDASALVGQTVTVEAIVVGDFQDGAAGADGDFNGFYIQEETSTRTATPGRPKAFSCLTATALRSTSGKAISCASPAR